MKKYYFTIIAFIFLATANAQIINFPDANFKAKLLAADVTNQIARNLIGDYFKIDSNSDGEIQFTEALQVASLYVDNSDISSLAGIEFFTAIVILNCFGNQLINLNLTSNIALIYLSCSFNQLTDLNISNNARIRELDCANNQLTSLNLSTNIDLTRVFCENNLLSNLNITNCSLLNELYCNNNQLTNLNLTSNISLNSLRCYNNQLSILIINNNVELNNLDCSNNLISVLDLINNLSLQTLDCKNNQLTNLNTSYNKSLFSLDCSNNLLTNLNLNNNTDLITLYCTNNLLETLLVKNGRNENTLVVLQNNPNLRFICADLGQVTEIQSYINALGLTAFCNVNDYCTFAPGGTNYTILVDNKVDANINGCDIFDIPLANLKYTVTNITNSGSLISNSSGNFSIPVQEGTTTITPILQNPSYFNVSPTSLSVTFPATANTVIQNFCITPTNLHQDISITILPITVARPGFDATYKIIYKNKGNVTVSGTVNFTFSDAETDFVSAIPAISSQNGGTLYFNYTNLMPFETRAITVVLNLNSPQEIPPLIAGSILNFEASIEPISGDEDSGDNIFEMPQTVVNSYDPNDKTCLDGNKIAPTKVGDYVHYMIRFENTGTFPAHNVVVKDMIDTTKFDIATLIPVSSSHDFVTKISDTNKVEFIFENINLPFDNATNDGYVAFKIKTKSTLVLGNTFSNAANIYFDYNFPIVTNTATTTVSNVLNNQDFEFSSYFNLYPNPTRNILTIDNLKNINISSISIYNTLGQVIQVITTPTKTIDVSELKSGNYLLKIISDNGSSFEKFIKE